MRIIVACATGFFESKLRGDELKIFFQRYRSKPAPFSSARMSAFARCRHVAAYTLDSNTIPETLLATADNMIE